MSEVDSSKNRGDFKFRYRPLPDTDDWELMTYAKNHPFLDDREALALPARSYWMPFVKASKGKLTRNQLEQAAWGAVFALLRQVDYICTSFGLDRSRLGMWATTVPLGAIPTVSRQQIPSYSGQRPGCSPRERTRGRRG